MSSATDPASRLAFHVKWRRANLALNQMEVWRAGGPSNTTLTEIENGRVETLTNATAKKLDAGLQWQPGSAMRVWRDEGRPLPLEEAVGAPVQDEPAEEETLLYRRPDGLSDQEWERVKRDSREYIEWQIEKASRER